MAWPTVQISFTCKNDAGDMPVTAAGIPDSTTALHADAQAHIRSFLEQYATGTITFS